MLKEDCKSIQTINYTIIILSTSAGSPINIGPTITEIPSPLFPMIAISIESTNTDPDIYSTVQSIRPSAASAHSTEVRYCLSCYLVHCFDIFSFTL